MSFQKKLLVGALALCGLLVSPIQMRAQSFGLAVSATPNPVTVSNAVTYTLFVTNTSGFTLSPVFVTNAVSDTALVGLATNSLFGGNEVIPKGVFFVINNMLNQDVAEITLVLLPQFAGSFTNQITVATVSQLTVTTNVVVQVLLPPADLAIGLTNVQSGVSVGDQTVVGLFVTNLGPSAASGVVVSNQLPTNFTLLSLSPANASTTFTNGNLTWNVGALANGGRSQLFVTVSPTNAGSFNLSASVSGSVTDTNTANNSVTNLMNIGGSLSSDLRVGVVTQWVSRQTGLLQMQVIVTNNATTNVPAFRVVTSGLPANTYLYNAAGTNAGVAYALYNSSLAGNGATVSLLLEFYSLTGLALTNQPTAQAVTAIDLTASSTNGVTVTKIVKTASDEFLIEFSATIGKTYTIIYASNPGATNWQTAQPSIVAPANRVQWLDNGPPKTASRPISVTSRLYRVLESP